MEPSQGVGRTQCWAALWGDARGSWLGRKTRGPAGTYCVQVRVQVRVEALWDWRCWGECAGRPGKGVCGCHLGVAPHGHVRVHLEPAVWPTSEAGAAAAPSLQPSGTQQVGAAVGAASSTFLIPWSSFQSSLRLDEPASGWVSGD